MKKKNSKFIIIIFLVLFISIGYAFLTTDLSISGISFIKQNTWDVHFANIVDDSFSSEVNNPATISSNGKKVNFEVTFNNPGEEYYFYVDVVNEGTLDAMLDLYEVTGLSDEQKNYIEWEITYSDGIELTKYDKLPKNSKDTLKVLVRFKDNIDISVLPNENETLNLTFKSIYVQADKSANERTTVEDKTAPDINFASNSSGTVKGNNKWYKSISILSKLVDPSGISSAKYCVTTNDTCTPDQTTDIKNNSIAFQLTNNALGQTVCVEGIDTKENDDVVCSKEKYYVDGEEPTINKVTANSLDDTISITLAAQDEHSGINKYYYSKDGGTSYISSKNNNYTFAGLEPDDYIVMDYVEDNAGNTSSTNTTTSTVRIRSWCEKNEITTLSDCAIAQGMNNKDVEGAKQEIESKEKPDFSKTSPTLTYKEKHSSSLTYRTINFSTITYSNEYIFDNVTGQYTLKNPSTGSIESLPLGTTSYYTLLSTGKTGLNLYKLNSVVKKETSSGLSYEISSYNYTYDIDTYDMTDVGMYSDSDNLGTTYYYRGSVGGNFVKFANMYWRIIRINGDGSVRLMYFSDNDTTHGKNAFNSKFNSNYWDPTYVGFMYNDSEFSKTEITSAESTFNNFAENTVYYYSKNYSWNDETKRFSLVGPDMISGIWKEKYQDILNNGYVYTCFGSEESSTCPVLLKITGYSNGSTVKVKYISHSSTSYDNAIKNFTKSTVLNELEKWYISNIDGQRDADGNFYSDFIVNSLFCNDKSLSARSGNGDGFNFYPLTYYGAYRRLAESKTPSYKCPNIDSNGFTLKGSNIGNEKLDYPVGMISSDEVSFAGGVNGKANPFYYINYNDNAVTWTLSPAYFNSANRASNEWRVDPSGYLNANWVNTSDGVRPVISLSKDVLVAGGDGTADNPYTVKLN